MEIKIVFAFTWQFGNTCYCNSVLQALYFCRPFRENVLSYKAQQKKKENLLTCLADLFHSIATQKKKVGVIPPKKFISRLRKENGLGRGWHSAPGFFLLLMWRGREKRCGQLAVLKQCGLLELQVLQAQNTLEDRKLCLELFSGLRVNHCWWHWGKSIKNFEELITVFTYRDFSNTETLCSEQKYYCETCCSKQEAQKRMRVKKLPMILALHLKRFKYMEQLHRYTKLSYRVVFPLELRLFNTSGDAVNLDRMYDLVAVVVHCGSGPNRGHYITIVKSHGFWLLFDDDIVEVSMLKDTSTTLEFMLSSLFGIKILIQIWV
uniref:Ubiquitin carboxyl-terminal hydrolase 46 n=1 Tax=Pavo cristatus TaxID=9049 RepID=A0A8C9EJF9_PAVCR